MNTKITPVQRANMAAYRNPINEAFAEHRRVLAERDELVAALQAIAGSHQTADTYTGRDGWEKAHDKFVAFARAALAKVGAA